MTYLATTRTKPRLHRIMISTSAIFGLLAVVLATDASATGPQSKVDRVETHEHGDNPSTSDIFDRSISSGGCDFTHEHGVDPRTSALTCSGDGDPDGPDAIVGGEDAPDVYPFMVSLQRTASRHTQLEWDPDTQTVEITWTEWVELPADDELDGHRCGATLIAPSWVLTAAHCVEEVSQFGRVQYQVDALIGPHVLTEDGPVVERITVDNFETAPGYTVIANVLFNDLALLHLAEPSEGTPVSLRGVDANDDHPSRLLGWGRTEFNGSPSDVLQQADVAMTSPSTCLYGPDNLCFVSPDAGTTVGSCIGDSGGPSLLIEPSPTGAWIQTGVSSFTLYGCSGISSYTNLTPHAVFIMCTAYVPVLLDTPPSQMPC